MDPTSAPARVLGSRAMKKICASTFSANGTERSNARRRLMCVDPISGASRMAPAASNPKPTIVAANRRPKDAVVTGLLQKPCGSG